MTLNDLRTVLSAMKEAVGALKVVSDRHSEKLQEALEIVMEWGAESQLFGEIEKRTLEASGDLHCRFCQQPTRVRIEPYDNGKCRISCDVCGIPMIRDVPVSVAEAAVTKWNEQF